MIFLKNDYGLGAHPRILKALEDANSSYFPGYGLDPVCEEAVSLLRGRVECEEADVHFLTGGTQTNLTALSAFLRPHHAVLATHTAHIYTHETGSIEACGHKVIPLPSEDGKLTPRQIEEAVLSHTDEHMVKPRLVYLSNTTELGSVYSRDELEAVRAVCEKYSLYLYLDGARLGCALTAEGQNLTLADLSHLTDAFSIGGTKNGALFGEALVITNDGLKEDFRFHMKQKGAMLAKGWLLGLQFRELFKDDLYFELARHANEMARLLSGALMGGGYEFLLPPASNQLFVRLPNMLIEHLRPSVAFEPWDAPGDRASVIRLVTSWGTTEEDIMEFMKLL